MSATSGSNFRPTAVEGSCRVLQRYKGLFRVIQGLYYMGAIDGCIYIYRGYTGFRVLGIGEIILRQDVYNSFLISTEGRNGIEYGMEWKDSSSSLTRSVWGLGVRASDLGLGSRVVEWGNERVEPILKLLQYVV